MVEGSRRRCNKNKKYLCKREEFKFNCPNLCDACSGKVGTTERPTISPTKTPTTEPTKTPTISPSVKPTETPTRKPTNAPTLEPTKIPTKKPTLEPTKIPTKKPTKDPTRSPTGKPTAGGPAECSGAAPNCCMGLTNTCELRINELFFAAMHNANNDDDKWNSNHEAPLEEALEAGFRAFYLDVCMCRGKIVFCHANCFWAGQQDPTEIFENVVQFLNKNPSELVIFNFQISYGSPSPLQLWNVMKNVNGLQNMSYVHNGGTWPKLKNLLQDGKQIISLKHNGENCLNTANSGCTPYIQEFFKYTVGTKWDFDSVSQIRNTQYSCVGARGTAYEK